MDLTDQARDFRGGDGIIADIGRDDLGRKLDAGEVITGSGERGTIATAP